MAARLIQGFRELPAAVAVSLARALALVFTLSVGILSAHYFGTTAPKDAYLVAETIPGLLRTIILGGLWAPLIITLSEIGSADGAIAQVVFTRRTIVHLTLGLAPLAVLMAFGAPVLVSLLAPGFTTEQAALTGRLIPITATTMLASILFAIVRCLFHARQVFAEPAFVSVLPPICSLLSVSLFVPWAGIYTLALGPAAGNILATLVLVLLVPLVLRLPTFGHRSALPASSGRYHSRLWTSFAPMILAANCSQVNLLVDNLFGSYLPAGSITTLAFGTTIMLNAAMITSQSLGEVALAELATAATVSTQQMRDVLRSRLRYMVLVTAPLAFGALAFGTPLIRLLFERGAFDAAATRGVADILACYSLEVVFTGYVLVLSGVLYARRKFALLAGLSFAAILSNAALDAVLMRVWAVKGLALATTLVALLLALGLAPFVRREMGAGIHDRSDRPYLAKIFASAGAMALLVRGWSAAFEALIGTQGVAVRLLEVGGGLGLGALAYVLLVRMAGIEEATTLLRRTLAPFWPSAQLPRRSDSAQG